jgi:hypothetical protein
MMGITSATGHDFVMLSNFLTDRGKVSYLDLAWETLTPYPDDLMVAWPVSTRVNTPKNNDAKLIEPSWLWSCSYNPAFDRLGIAIGVGLFTGYPRGVLPNSPLSTLIMTVDNLLCFFPRAANFLGPFFVTAPIIELIGDRGVTAADPLRILRFGCCRFDSARFWACRAEERLRQSSRSFAVAHFVPR